MYALKNCRIYTGLEILDHHVVLIEGDKIIKVCAESQIPSDVKIEDLNGAILAPGFIDIQLNGCGGVQFNETLDALSIETLNQMHTTNLLTGCTNYLPTLITSTDEFIYKAVKVMREYLRVHPNQALGLHIEGPYINVEKKGIHNEQYIRQLDQKMTNFLCDNADMIKILTLAPEKVDSQYITQLAQSGITVSVGHTNATYEQTRHGFSAGIRLGTHLFNAMPAITGRMPGVVGAIYDESEVYCGIIADGLHVSWANIRNSYKIKRDKLVLVTDAILPVGTSLTQCTFGGKTVYYKDGKCFDKNGTLGGSALTMIEAVENCVKHVGLSLDETLRMATLYPAKAIGIDKLYGTISSGKVANLVIFNDKFKVLNTIVNGQITT